MNKEQPYKRCIDYGFGENEGDLVGFDEDHAYLPNLVGTIMRPHPIPDENDPDSWRVPPSSDFTTQGQRV